MIEITNDYWLDADKYEWRILRYRGTFVDSRDGQEKPRYETMGHYAKISQAMTSCLDIMLKESVENEIVTDLTTLAAAAASFKDTIKEKLEEVE
ncbi:hypothetical protein [Faecalibaculum rodentium]|jgi:hypothetical protein|uniref:hypothetical protein n=1 Tax=Faecalibaculum rodentium TaxID=1702221 RepID=UPI0025B199BF|nr:hypothetical protein [Faecalibaculum rodentium]